MRLLFNIATIFLLATSFFANAQTKKSFYYNADGEQTTGSLAEYKMVYTEQPDGLYSFEKRKMSNDRLLMKGHCVTPDSQSRTGSYVSYSDGGLVDEEGTYLDNKQEGFWKYYTDSGKLSSEGKFINGKKEGVWKYYYENSKQLWYSVDMVAGVKDGTLKSYYKNGKLKRIEQLDKGSTISGNCYDKDGKDIEFTPFLQMAHPDFSITEYLAKNVTYPRQAQDHGIEGKVHVFFVVDKEGNITELKIKKSVSRECDAEVLRVMRRMPKWVPGIQDDELIKVSYTQPVTFKLQ